MDDSWKIVLCYWVMTVLKCLVKGFSQLVHDWLLWGSIIGALQDMLLLFLICFVTSAPFLNLCSATRNTNQMQVCWLAVRTWKCNFHACRVHSAYELSRWLENAWPWSCSLIQHPSHVMPGLPLTLVTQLFAQMGYENISKMKIKFNKSIPVGKCYVVKSNLSLFLILNLIWVLARELEVDICILGRLDWFLFKDIYCFS